MQGRSAKRMVLLAPVIAAAALVASCGEKPEVDQIAQHSMTGMSVTKLKACLGRPSRSIPAGLDEIWVYPIGRLEGYGPQFAVVLNENVPPLGVSGACDVRVVVNRYGVSQVGYSLRDGEALPLGQTCRFAVERCVAPAAP